MATHCSDDENLGTMNPSTVLLNHRRWLWVVIYSRLGDALETEEVLQEVSVAAVSRGQEFAETGHAKSWLYQVAVRQSMLLRRRQHRHRAKLRGYVRDSPPPDSKPYIQWLCDDEQADHVRQALAQLKPGDRQVLMLKYCDDYSCAMIAESLGVKETTVQSRLLRAPVPAHP